MWQCSGKHSHVYSVLKLRKQEWSNKVREEFPSLRHESFGKRRVQQFFCCVYICCRGEVSTEPLPSNDGEIHIDTWGIYEVRRLYELRCHDISTKFHKVWFRYSKVDGGYTDRQHGDLISLLFIFSKLGR
jgi:hypothetical protein